MSISMPIPVRATERLRLENWVFLLVGISLAFLVIVPLGVLILATFSPDFRSLGRALTLQNYVKAYSNFRYYVDLGNTLFLAATVTVAATALGCVLAWIVGRTNVPGARLLELLITVPLYVSPFLGALGWAVAVRPGAGIIGSLIQQISYGSKIDLFSPWGIIWVLSLYMAPYAFAFVVASMRSMDPALEQAASMVGLGIRRTALRITMPLVSPAVLSATLLIFISVVGQFQVPALFGVPANYFVITTRIFALTQTFPADWSLAAALGTMPLIVSMLGVFVQVKALGTSLKSFATITGRGYRQGQIDLGQFRLSAAALAWLYVLVGVIIPIGTLVYTSFLPEFSGLYSLSNLTLDNYVRAVNDDPRSNLSILNTLSYSAIAATLSLALTSIASWIIYRSHVRGRRLLEFICMVPSAIPGTVLAVAFLWSFIYTPLYNTMWILILAYVAGFIPFGVRAILPSLSQIDPSLEESGRMSGLNWFRIFGQIVVPLIRPSFIAAWLLLFMLFVKELNLSIMLSTRETQVLSVSIYSVWTTGQYNEAAALATIQIALIAVVVILVSRFVGGRDFARSL